jgi:hypothetical protein
MGGSLCKKCVEQFVSICLFLFKLELEKDDADA